MARIQIQTFHYDDFGDFDRIVNDFIITIPILNIRRYEWHNDKICIWYEIAEPGQEELE